MQGDGTRPALDVYARITDGTVDAAKLFWPVNVMPPAPSNGWIARSLSAASAKAMPWSAAISTVGHSMTMPAASMRAPSCRG
jgi:hypothetical protein